MDSLKQIGRAVAGGCLGAVGGFAVFGLLLAIAWQIPVELNVRYKAVTTLLAAAAGLTVGGYIVGLLDGRRRTLYGAAFGMLFGLIAFGYILGPRWQVLIAGGVASLLGALGAWLAVRPAGLRERVAE